MSESTEQKAVISWFNIQYPKLRGCLFSNCNGAVLSGGKVARAIQMNRLKAEGLKCGVSDLFLAVPVNGFAGLWIEMKDIKKKISDVSPAQQAHIDQMIKMGYGAVWCAGAKQAIDTINGYLNGVR